MARNTKKLTDKELAYERLRVIFWWQRMAGLITLLLSLKLIPLDKTGHDIVADWFLSVVGIFLAAMFLLVANKTRKALGFKWSQL